MHNLQLSENLYPVDEVIATFTQCILMRSTIHECLYWLWELIYTCDNLGEILIDIYQHFYSLSHESVGKYIVRKIHKFNTLNDRRQLADVVCNLRLFTPCPTSYYINHYYMTCVTPTVIYKRTLWMHEYPIHMRGLIGSIHSRNIYNIGYYLKSSVNQYGLHETYAVILKYCNQQGVDIHTGLCENTLSCLISRCLHKVDSEKTHFIRSNITTVTEIDNHFNRPSNTYYHKLRERRLYSTHPFMPPGEYKRFQIKEGLEEACNMHWEYYCFASLAWNKRFIQYGGCLDHRRRSIQWTNEDDLENFYDNDNCMDFDEQSKTVKEMSLHPIDVIADPYVWFRRIVNESITYGIAKISL